MTVRSDVFGYLDGNLSAPVYKSLALPLAGINIPCVVVNVTTIEAGYDGSKNAEADYDATYTIAISAVVSGNNTGWADEAESLLEECKAILLPQASSFNAAYELDKSYTEQYSVDAEGDYILGIGLLTLTVTGPRTY